MDTKVQHNRGHGMATKIRGIDLLATSTAKLSLSEFSTVDRLLFSAVRGSARYDLELVLLTDGLSSNFRACIRFERVSGLELKEFGGSIAQVRGLEIHDISDAGWEQKNWEVRDFENSRVSFTCEHVEICSVDPC